MTTTTVLPKRHVALRIATADLVLIDQLAAKYGLDRMDYMVRASTGALQDPIAPPCSWRPSLAS